MADIGLIGLGVMGAALARNLIDHGVEVCGFEPLADQMARPVTGDFPVAADLPDLVTRLTPPRVILMMVTAGPPVDAMISQLSAYLSPGDVIIDGGNSHYQDSQRRAELAVSKSLSFVGLGISGGEAGARFGPAMMAGGTADSVQIIAPLLAPIAAQTSDGSRCFSDFGPPAAGHFVKMVHNAIEYGEMQLLAEIFGLGKYAGGQSNSQLAELFASWADRTYGGYLVETSARVLRQVDDQTSGDLIDQIAPVAGQKGTGRWAITAALDLGQAVPTLAAAVFARSLTVRAGEQHISAVSDSHAICPAEQLYDAFALAKLATYEQGLRMLAAATEHHKWPLDLAAVARVWRAGCILRGPLLETLVIRLEGGIDAAIDDPDLAGLPALRQVLARAATSAVSVPALAASLSYLEGLSEDRPTAQMIQGQRDAFGAHGFARRDRPGVFHAHWSSAEDR